MELGGRDARAGKQYTTQRAGGENIAGTWNIKEEYTGDGEVQEDGEACNIGEGWKTEQRNRGNKSGNPRKAKEVISLALVG